MHPHVEPIRRVCQQQRAVMLPPPTSSPCINKTCHQLQLFQPINNNLHQMHPHVEPTWGMFQQQRVVMVLPLTNGEVVVVVMLEVLVLKPCVRAV